MDPVAKRIPIELIVLSRYARERHLAPLDPRAVALARETEIIAPVVVRAIGNPGFPKFELLAGKEGWTIAQHLLMPTVPAVVLDGLSEVEAKSFVEIHEGLEWSTRPRRAGQSHGDPLDWAEVAKQHLAEERRRETGYTQRRAAERLGLDYTTLSHGLRMVNQLREPARTALRTGHLTLGHAKALTAFTGTAQDAMVEQLVRNRASVRVLEEAAKACRTNRKTEVNRDCFRRDIDIVRLEGRLTEVTGIPVSIEYRAEKQQGRVILAFADLDGFDAILERLGVRLDEE